ncbi:hypothetical protein PWA85_001707, partial [Campylobacter coli]|nr:hypothetical protein [Campylobacter coli]
MILDTITEIITLDRITEIITLDRITKIITIVGFCLAFFQLRNVIKNTKVNVLKTEFDIFGKISEKEKI